MSTRRSAAAALLLAVALGAAGARAATTHRQGAPMFKDTTYEELQPYAPADRLVAVVRCDAIETVSPGSRSERQQIRASLLAGPPGIKPGSPLQLSRYAQGAPLMTVGASYLVAAYRDSASGPWALLEHREVRPEAAAGEFAAATADIARRLDKPSPR